MFNTPKKCGAKFVRCNSCSYWARFCSTACFYFSHIFDRSLVNTCSVLRSSSEVCIWYFERWPWTASRGVSWTFSGGNCCPERIQIKVRESRGTSLRVRLNIVRSSPTFLPSITAPYLIITIWRHHTKCYFFWMRQCLLVILVIEIL